MEQESFGEVIPKVTQLANNQFIIKTEEFRVFQSYNSIIAIKYFNGQVVLDENTWDYSRTTGKYRGQFLNEGIQETRKKIERGEYVLAKLN